jgi:ATP/ADP translocase
MRITWKHGLLSFLTFIGLFIGGLSMPQPYRMYAGGSSMFFILLAFVLWLVSDLQKTDQNWRKFEKLKEDKDFTNYIEEEFEKVKFNFNFKSQMVLGSKDINYRMKYWDKLKKEVDKNDT